jgi:hypothetical protein
MTPTGNMGSGVKLAVLGTENTPAVVGDGVRGWARVGYFQ